MTVNQTATFRHKVAVWLVYNGRKAGGKGCPGHGKLSVTREVLSLDKIDERLARMEDLIHQLIGTVAKTNSAIVDLEVRLTERIDGLEHRLDGRIDALEQRLDGRIDGLEQRFDGLEQRLDRIGDLRRDVVVLKSESDHFARKIGVLERDMAVVRTKA